MKLADDKKSVLVTLIEPVNLLKAGITEYVETLIFKNFNKKTYSNIPVQHLGGYDHYDFFICLLDDLIDGMYEAPTPIMMSSVQVLINDKIDARYALELTFKVMRCTTGVIQSAFPEINFRSDGYRFNLCDGVDLYIAPPYLDGDFYNE